MTEMNQPITSIDLFCGAGGLTLGLAGVGVATALASDNWEPASATFQQNFPEMSFLPADVSDLTAQDLLAKSGLDRPPSLVVGGPPCQGFSSAGARRRHDGRNGLVAVFARLIAETRPAAFIFENVEGFLTMDGGRFVTDLLDPVIEAGYYVHLRKVNVANFGVPQLRKRVVGVGFLGSPPPFPTATHSAKGAPGVHRIGAGLPATPSLAEALDGLPKAGVLPDASPSDHVARPSKGADAERARALAQGQTMRDLPPEFHHASYQRRANRRVADGMPTERRGGAPAGLRRLRADEPSKAITSAAPREFIHPTEDRPLTLRECARLQTFPDWFEFLGSQAHRATLIGNAVPPTFASALAEPLVKFLRENAPDPKAGRGSLVSFEPTVAEGRSPILQSVTELITGRYGMAPTLFDSQP
jgi:DNA (cytosine-5)-methyltransferase 1